MWQEKNNSLYRKIKFKDFDEAFRFIEELASIAKRENHHPEFKSNYDEIEVWLTTHSEGKVTGKDRKFAQQIDTFLEAKSGSGEVKTSTAKLFTDGGSRGNPGPAATGVVILDMEDNVVKKSSTYLGKTTNNQAEYQALSEGLRLAQTLGVEELSVYMDSELIVKQINGIYKIKNADLKPHYDDVLVLADKFRKISFTHVPRAMNKLADEMVNECLDKQK
ncbi:MAG TPA: reverse transcriptase-like protein [Candidatus Saccharimonadales bacterium]|nr:reverse transcriptase-like protein [Candidatus Saccharimonadales bacterium]